MVLLCAHQLGLHAALLDFHQHCVPGQHIAIDLIVHAPFLVLTKDKPLEHLIAWYELSAQLSGLTLSSEHVRRIIDELNQVAGHISEGDRSLATVVLLIVIVRVDLAFFLEVGHELLNFLLFRHSDGHRRNEVFVDVLQQDKGRLL